LIFDRDGIALSFHVIAKRKGNIENQERWLMAQHFILIIIVLIQPFMNALCKYYGKSKKNELIPFATSK
jgi:predicted amino acid-binding ACT domain protein